MTKTASERFLTTSPANLVAGDFRPLAGGDGDAIQSVNPASPDDVVFESATRRGDVADAVAAARAALPAWSGRSLEERVSVLRRWQELTKANADRIADLIVLEMGKVRGECLFEANALGGKGNDELRQDFCRSSSRISCVDFLLCKRCLSRAAQGAS